MDNKLGVLVGSEYAEFRTLHEAIPVIANEAFPSYRITSNMNADFYYMLLIPDLEKEDYIKKFVEQEVGNNFSNAVTSLSQGIRLSNFNFQGKLKYLCLIGINKDWTFQFVPVGMAIKCNTKPSINGAKNKAEYREENLRKQANEFAARISSSRQRGNSSFVESQTYDVKPSHQIEEKITINKPSGILFEPDNMIIYRNNIFNRDIFWILDNTRNGLDLSDGGSASFEVLNFSGDYPKIKISWTKEIEYIQFNNRNRISLSDYESPHEFQFYYNTSIGDNSLPFKVVNCYGISSECSIFFQMHSTEDNSTYIENNIINSPNSSINIY